jgi:hypothetical protein
MTPVIGLIFSIIVGLASYLVMLWTLAAVHRGSRLASACARVGGTEVAWWPRARPVAALALADAFDLETCMLWETQMPALHMIEAHGDHGIATEKLLRWHAEAARTFPELYDGSDFYDWVLMLESCDLVERRNGRVSMTAAGTDFMRVWERVGARTNTLSLAG